MDLMSTANKKLEALEAQATSEDAAGKESTDAALVVKRDRLQDELNSIEEQLFELEKKYGEVQARPRRKAAVVAEDPVSIVDEQAAEEPEKEEEEQSAAKEIEE